MSKYGKSFPYIALLIVMIILALIIGNSLINERMRRLNLFNQAEVEQVSESLSYYLQTQINAAKGTVSHASLFDLDEMNEQTVAAARNALDLLIRQDNAYFQTRVLNEQGKEIIKIVKTPYGTKQIDNEDMQNKAKRDYLIDAINGKVGEIFFSNIDLNIENGQIELPYKPTLRVITKFNTLTSKQYLLIINIDIQRFLNSVKKQEEGMVTSAKTSTFTMLSNNGNYLITDSLLNRFGGFLPDTFSYQQQHPKLWSDVVNSAPDQLLRKANSTWYRVSLVNDNGNTKQAQNIQRVTLVSSTDPLYISSYKYKIWLIVAASSLFIFVILSALVVVRQRSRETNKMHQKELNRAAEEVKSAYVMLQDVSDEIPVGLVYADSELKTVFFNKPVAPWLSKKAELHQHITKNLHSRIIEHITPLLAQAKDGQTHSVTLDVSINDAIRYTEVSIFSHQSNSGAKELFYLLVFTNVSEKMETQIQLETLNFELSEQTLKAQANSSAKSQFLANMSHEIRTPMNGLLGMIQLLKLTKLNTSQQKYADTMHSSATALLRILNDILDLSKLEAGKLAIERVKFDLEVLLSQIIDTYAVTAANQDIELVVKIDPELNINLIGDDFRIKQVLSNFVSNALKFTSSGSVVLEARRLAGSKFSTNIYFAVVDSGMGMSKEQSERVFDSFEQADNSTTRKFGGTGLGLSISRDIIHKMNGKIGVISNENIGSTFWISIPLDIDIITNKIKHWSLESKHVLIVDDQLEAREVVRHYLDTWKVEVTEAHSAADALSKIKQADEQGLLFDIVITDWKMPEHDGLWLIEQMALLNIAQSPQILMITAFDKALVQKEHSERLEHIKILTKPILASDLFNCLNQFDLSNESSQRIDEVISIDNKVLVGLHILAVDDNDINLAVATSMLEESGATVDVAHDGAMAIDKVCSNSFDAVLMDYQMPVLDGIKATQILREKNINLPIIAMTAAGYQEDLDAYFSAGMNDVILKPFELNDMLNTILKVIKQHKEALD